MILVGVEAAKSTKNAIILINRLIYQSKPRFSTPTGKNFSYTKFDFSGVV